MHFEDAILSMFRTRQRGEEEVRVVDEVKQGLGEGTGIAAAAKAAAARGEAGVGAEAATAAEDEEPWGQRRSMLTWAMQHDVCFTLETCASLALAL